MADQTIDTTAAQKLSKGFKAIGKDASGNLGYIICLPTIVPTITGTPATDTAVINAALSGGNVHVLINRDVTINASLVVYSNTHLELSPGSSITFPATTGPMLYNRSAFNPQRTISDAGMIVGSTTITSSTAVFTSADVGRSVVVDDAGAQGKWSVAPYTIVGGPLCADIISVESATSATLEFPAQQTVTGKTAIIYDRDKNIKLSGGSYSFTGVSNPEDGKTRGIGNTRMMNFFRRIDGLVVDNVNLHNTTWSKYALNLGDVRNARISNVTFDTATDGLHIRGPGRDIRAMNITGYTGDDFTAITCADNIVYNDIQGDVEGVVFENINGNTPHNNFKIVSTTGIEARNVTARNYSNTTDKGILKALIYDDPLCGLGVGTKAKGLLIENWQAYTVGISLSSTGGGDATLRDIRRLYAKPTSETAWTDSFNFGTGAIWDDVLIDNYIDITNSYHHNAVVVSAGANIGKLTLTNSKMYTNSTDTESRAFSIYAGTIADLVIDNFDKKYGGLINQRTGSTVKRTRLSNIFAESNSRFYDVSSNANITMNNFYVLTPANPSFYASGGSIMLSGSGYNGQRVNSSVARAATESVIVLFPDLPVNLTQVSPYAGGAVYNTNSGLSCGTGPVVSGGTTWKHLVTEAVYTP